MNSPENIYRKLAERLDEIPNGFPATESGVELKILAKLFTPAEAQIASSMSTDPLGAPEIGKMNEMAAEEIKPVLAGMARKGLIEIKKIEGIGLGFNLIPFVVGFYERQNGNIDREFAELFEQYYHESFHGMMTMKPSVHRVIPVEKAIPANIDVMPYEKASLYLEKAESWGVLKCICRVQKRLIGEACGHSEENCLAFSSRKGAFDRAEGIRAITREEAFGILAEAEKEGLVHSAGNSQNDINYICNCCSCSCGVMRGIAEYGSRDSIAGSDYIAVVDPDSCTGCESCLQRCHFDALSIVDGICLVNRNHCFGCGLCISECPEGAIELLLKPEGEKLVPPLDEAEWRRERARARQSGRAIST